MATNISISNFEICIDFIKPYVYLHPVDKCNKGMLWTFKFISFVVWVILSSF
jgi:hypothetical protein